MELLKAVILGVVQGLTEFLPVSSSGHLVIGAEILGFKDTSGIAFEVFLHLGTLLAVIIVFRRELMLMIRSLFVSAEIRRQDPELSRLYSWNFFIVIATVPAVVVGLFLKDSIEMIFDYILITFAMLAVTGTIMMLTKKIPNGQKEVNGSRAFLIGIAQAMAIMPGLSRSGSTIFTGMLLGINRETAARFSFVMSIPAILGAAVIKLGDLINSPPGRDELLGIGIGTVASVISGYFAIILLMGIVKKGRLHWFGYYCFAISGMGFFWYFAM